MNNSIEEIRCVIDNSNNIIIAGHTNPDGDAIGAVFALSYALKSKNKNLYVLLENYSEKFNCIPGNEHIYCGDINNIYADLFISLDCGDIYRLGDLKPIFEKMNSINIDHHISNNYFGNYNYVDSNLSSTSEIVYNILNGWCEIDSNISACIYSGLINDTGGFRHTSTKPSTLEIASNIIHNNFNFSKIYNKLFYSHSFEEAKLMGEALINCEILCDKKFVFSFMSMDTMKKYNATPKNVDGISEYLKNINETLVAVFLYERSKNEIKVSLRTEDCFDASNFVKRFDGGGHKKAAGCTLKCDINDACDIIKKAISDELNKLK